MDILTEILNTLKEPGRLAAIGTLLLALATFLSLHQYRKSEQRRRNIDVSEKILKPLCIDLEELALRLESLGLPSSFRILHGLCVEERYPLWEKLKQESFYLLGDLDRKIIDKSDEFSKNMGAFIYLRNQNFEQFRNVVNEEIRNRIKREYLEGGIGEGIYYGATIGGKSIGGKNSHGILLQNLIFRGQTLEEYFGELAKDFSLLNKRVDNEFIIIGGSMYEDLGREVFELIASNVKQKISKNPELCEFMEMNRKIHRQIKRLIEDLQKERGRLSKD